MSDLIHRRDQRHRLDRQGYRIIAACTVLLAGAVAAMIATRPPARDPATACLTASKAAVQHVAVIDRTDPWTDADRALLAIALTSLAVAIPVDDRLTIISFDGSANTPPQPLFDRCRPPEGKDVNALLATPAKADRTHRVAFTDPLAKTLEEVTRPANAPDTHLVAFLTNLAATLTYQAKADAVAIHLYSDMAENTPTGSLLPGRRKQFDPASFTQHFKTLTKDRLGAITLHVHLVPTPTSSPHTSRRIKDAWITALAASGVRYSWRPL